MKEVRLLATTQTRIFPPDRIPLLNVMMPEFGKKLQSLFNFSGVAPVQQQENVVGISFNGGTYQPGAILIETVSIEARKIGVRVHGPSEVATSVFQAFSKQIQEINGDHPLNEILCSHDTGCSVVLDFQFNRIFSKQFAAFLEKSALKYVTNQWSDSLIVPANLKFAVRYKVTDDAIIKSNIGLASKELVIEPRAQSSLDESLYWIASPTDTTTHFQLIEELERAMKT